MTDAPFDPVQAAKDLQACSHPATPTDNMPRSMLEAYAYLPVHLRKALARIKELEAATNPIVELPPIPVCCGDAMERVDIRYQCPDCMRTE